MFSKYVKLKKIYQPNIRTNMTLANNSFQTFLQFTSFYFLKLYLHYFSINLLTNCIQIIIKITNMMRVVMRTSCTTSSRDVSLLMDMEAIVSWCKAHDRTLNVYFAVSQLSEGHIAVNLVPTRLRQLCYRLILCWLECIKSKIKKKIII